MNQAAMKQEALAILDALDGDERTGALSPLNRGILGTARNLRTCDFDRWPTEQQLGDLRTVLLAACPDALSYEPETDMEHFEI